MAATMAVVVPEAWTTGEEDEGLGHVLISVVDEEVVFRRLDDLDQVLRLHRDEWEALAKMVYEAYRTIDAQKPKSVQVERAA